MEENGMKKKLFALLLCCFMVVAFAAGCASDKPAESSAATEESSAAPSESTEASSEAPSESTEASASGEGFYIGFSNGYQGNTWRQQFVEGIEARLEMYKADGVVRDYMVTSANADITEQMNHINSMVNAGVDAIVVDPVSITALQGAVEAAQEAGILVVCTNEVAAYPNTYCVTLDGPSMAKIHAKFICEALGGEGNVVSITGVPGYASDVNRINASDEIFAEYDGVKLIASEPGNWSNADSQTVMSTFLATYGDEINAVLSQDNQSEGILQAYANAGVKPNIVGGDPTPAYLKIWRDEYSDLHSSCIPATTEAGAWGVDVAVGLLQGREVDESILKPNLNDASLVNMIELPPQYVIISEDDKNNMTEFVSWVETNYPTTPIYTREEAIAMCEEASLPDAYVLGQMLTDEQLNWIFKN